MKTSASLAPTFVLSCLTCLALGCSSDPKPPPKSSNDTVPANSVSEERLKGNEQPGAPKPLEKKDDPTQAVTTSVSGAPVSTGKEKDEKPPPPTKGGGGKVGSAECEQIWDKGLQLEIASNPALAGVDSAQLSQMAKQMAKDKHGSAPCDATQKQYACAMSAGTTARWKSCLK